MSSLKGFWGFNLTFGGDLELALNMAPCTPLPFLLQGEANNFIFFYLVFACAIARTRSSSFSEDVYFLVYSNFFHFTRAMASCHLFRNVHSKMSKNLMKSEVLESFAQLKFQLHHQDNCTSFQNTTLQPSKIDIRWQQQY